MATTYAQPQFGSLDFYAKELNGFALAVKEDVLNAGKPTDQHTPDRPIFRRILKKNGGKLKMLPPSLVIRHDVEYKANIQSTAMSLSNDFVDKDYTPTDNVTAAHYFWIQRAFRVTLPKVRFDNSQGNAKTLYSYFEQNWQELIKSRNTKMNDILWNGDSSGAEKVFGINDVLRTSVSTDPAKGAVGGLSAVTYDWWRPNYVNFNHAYKTTTSGATQVDLLHTEAGVSMLALWNDCTNNDDGDETGSPDLFVCNEVLQAYLHDLGDNMKRFFIHEDRFKLDLPDALTFRGAQVIFDRNVPAASGGAYGRGFFLNTSFWDFVGCEGIWQQQGPKEGVPGKEAWAWPEYSQYTQVWKGLRYHGTIDNVLAAAVS